MIEIRHLLLLADEYLRATETKEVTLSFWVFNDSKKLAALRTGSDITLGRFNAAVLWFSDNWPAVATWPADLPRPCSQDATSVSSVGPECVPLSANSGPILSQEAAE